LHRQADQEQPTSDSRPAAILQQAHQQQLTSDRQQINNNSPAIPAARHPSTSQHIQNNSQAIPAAILQQAHQEQLTSDSRRHPSTSTPRTTHQRFLPPSFSRQINNKSQQYKSHGRSNSYMDELF